jgi:hypothetical protein
MADIRVEKRLSRTAKCLAGAGVLIAPVSG